MKNAYTCYVCKQKRQGHPKRRGPRWALCSECYEASRNTRLLDIEWIERAGREG